MCGTVREHVAEQGSLICRTGCAGLLFAYLYHHLFPQYRPIITLTDIPEALHLIQHNKNVNLGHDRDWLSIKKLRWGSLADAKLVLRAAPVDVVLASDVLYEPASFKLLVESLVSLSTPGRTVIYLGYKRRGLKDEDEAHFSGSVLPNSTLIRFNMALPHTCSPWNGNGPLVI